MLQDYFSVMIKSGNKMRPRGHDSRVFGQDGQGNPKGGLAKGAEARKATIGPKFKGPFRGNFCSSPMAVGCGGIGPDRPRKGPDGPRKGPNQPRKVPISQKGFPPDFL